MSTASENFICPITQAEMTDPVICADGITYERSAIVAWFAMGHMTSPMTRQSLAHTTLIPNLALRNTIEAMRGGSAAVAATAAPAPASAAPAPVPSVTPSITINRIAGTTADYAIEISAPEAPDATLPTLFIDVLDISGSMRNASVDTSTNTSDAAHFSRADLVRHSVATQIELLRPQDKLALVLFDNNAEVALPPTQMTAIGRTAAKSCLPQIEPRGGTNIWTGLQRALTIAESVDTAAMNVVIILQTDGESDPIYNPPRGIPATFRAWLDSHPHVRVTLHTVGYGYGNKLDMPLLRELSTIGNGTVNYIADGSMVGTVFIHLMANLMSCLYRDLTLQVPEAGIAERIGFLQSGQTRHAVLRGLPSATSFTVCVRDPTTVILETTANPAMVPESRADFALARDRLLSTLRAELPKAEMNTFLNSSCLDAIYGYLVDAVTAPAADTRITHLLTDLREPLDVNKGQLSRAFASTSAFQRWGRHYIPWVISGHENEWAINFKDESSKHVYGTVTTRALVDRGDGIFTTLPPPKASIPVAVAAAPASYGTPSQLPAPLTSMASVHSSVGPCFLGASLVLMADGTKKRCDEIRPGDVAAPDYKIRCVIRTAVPHADVVQLGSQDPSKGPLETGGFTLWHPVFVNHAWRHPADLGKIHRVATDAIYNFVLEEGHILLINDIMTCTMGHDFTANAVIDHPYFGKRRAGQRNIRDDLEADPGWATGYIRWQNVQVQHDAVTGYICGMTSTPAPEMTPVSIE